VDRYQGRLLNFVYRTTGDRERAEDLVQETFIRIYRHLHRFDQSKKFSTWAYTIASNLAKNELRNRSRNPLVLFQVAEEELGCRRASAGVGGQHLPPGRSVSASVTCGRWWSPR
jgi:RNA polymerase sigma factor (sigma-70 family)